MKSTCIYGLYEDVIFDCSNPPKSGIEQDVLIMNWQDIDRSATLFNDNKTKIIRLRLHKGKRAYLFKGLKNLFQGQTKPLINNLANGHSHSLNIRVFENNENTIAQINNIINKGHFVAIVEILDKGITAKNAFEILGYDSGLEVDASSQGRNYNTNDGAYLLTLSTPKHLKEPRTPYKWLETDYQTTLRQFNNKLQKNSAKNKIFDRTFDNTFE